MEFGKLSDGTSIEMVELEADDISVKIMTLGAAIQSLQVPDRDGRRADIVLGYVTAAEYLSKPQYFGATVGRFANRIRNGQFELDGKRYQLAANSGSHHLHGGARGLDKVVWKIESLRAGPPASVAMSFASPDGDEGYPGTLEVTATYTLTGKSEITVEYRATTDKPTIVNITNHSYFNLAGEAGSSDVLGHRIMVLADGYTPVDSTLIPTGELRDVAGTPFDFRKPSSIGTHIRDGRDEQIRLGRGYDHNYVLQGSAGTLRLAARVDDPASGRVMELLTTAPGMQFYSGNFLDGSSVGKSGRIYRQSDAFCLEPQIFPDSPNHPHFPTALLNPGQVYTSTMVYRFGTSRS